MAQQNYYGLPNPLSPDAEKNSPEFGLKVMKTSYSQWLNGYGGVSQKQRQVRFDYNRAYATGQQPMQEFLDFLDINGQQPYSNLDYTPLPIAIPMIQRIKDRFNQRIEKIRCNAVDPVSISKKNREKADAEFRMKYKNDIQEIEQVSGMRLEDPDAFTPDDKDENEIYFGFNYKQREEVMMEQGIDLVIYAHGSCRSVSHGYSQNYFSYSCRTTSALVTVLVAWWTLAVNELHIIDPCPQHQPTSRTSGLLFLLTKIFPYCPSNNKYIHGNDYVDNNHCIF